MVIQQCQRCIICHIILSKSPDLINLPNPRLGSRDKGLKQAPKHLYSEAL